MRSLWLSFSSFFTQAIYERSACTYFANQFFKSSQIKSHPIFPVGLLLRLAKQYSNCWWLLVILPFKTPCSFYCKWALQGTTNQENKDSPQLLSRVASLIIVYRPWSSCSSASSAVVTPKDYKKDRLKKWVWGYYVDT